jgi:hypothetical protein
MFRGRDMKGNESLSRGIAVFAPQPDKEPTAA